MKPSPRLVAVLLVVLAAAVAFAYNMSRPAALPSVSPGTNARTRDAPDH
jgi:hypothetical protein